MPRRHQSACRAGFSIAAIRAIALLAGCGASSSATASHATTTPSGTASPSAANAPAGSHSSGAVASCPSGSYVSGGGFAADPSSYINAMSANGGAWQAYVSPSTTQMNVYAECLSFS